MPITKTHCDCDITWACCTNAECPRKPVTVRYGTLMLMKEERQAIEEDLRKAYAKIDDIDVCMCGSLVKDHDYGSGHSPVSAHDYHMDVLEKQLEKAQDKLFKINALVTLGSGMDIAVYTSEIINILKEEEQ